MGLHEFEARLADRMSFGTARDIRRSVLSKRKKEHPNLVNVLVVRVGAVKPSNSEAHHLGKTFCLIGLPTEKPG